MSNRVFFHVNNATCNISGVTDFVQWFLRVVAAQNSNSMFVHHIVEAQLVSSTYVYTFCPLISESFHLLVLANQHVRFSKRGIVRIWSIVVRTKQGTYHIDVVCCI
jgi:uncharacterized membrane protein